MTQSKFSVGDYVDWTNVDEAKKIMPDFWPGPFVVIEIFEALEGVEPESIKVQALRPNPGGTVIETRTLRPRDSKWFTKF